MSNIAVFFSITILIFLFTFLHILGFREVIIMLVGAVLHFV